jgi:hypothetical protein
MSPHLGALRSSNSSGENGTVANTEPAAAEPGPEPRKSQTQAKAASKKDSAVRGLQELLGLKPHLRVFNEIRVNPDTPYFMLIQLIIYV